MTPAPTSEARTRRLVWSLLIVTLASVGAAGAWRLVAGTIGASPPLPVYGTVPPFSLIERSGRSVSADDLAGRVWVADFIFTRCRGTCPILSAKLAALLRRLEERGPPGILAVSVSVDPVHDDPETLRRYAARYGADPERWLFLTGDRDAVVHLVREGFLLSVAELPPGEREGALEPITHSDRFALVDAQLRIRGYYHGTDDADVTRLERDLGRLQPGT